MAGSVLSLTRQVSVCRSVFKDVRILHMKERKKEICYIMVPFLHQASRPFHPKHQFRIALPGSPELHRDFKKPSPAGCYLHFRGLYGILHTHVAS